MKLFRPYAPIRWLFSGRVWRVNSDDEVFLTFDDGPTRELTDRILDILDQYEAKATFFCVGENARSLPELMDRIREKGHAVGNHCMSHDHSFRTAFDLYMNSVESASEWTSDQLFRPPYGRLKLKKAIRLRKKYKIIMWTWLSYDFDRSVPIQLILEKAKKQIRAGDIIVLHDNIKVQDRIEEILPDLLAGIQEKGLKFGVISA